MHEYKVSIDIVLKVSHLWIIGLGRKSIYTILGDFIGLTSISRFIGTFVDMVVSHNRIFDKIGGVGVKVQVDE